MRGGRLSRALAGLMALLAALVLCAGALMIFEGVRDAHADAPPDAARPPASESRPAPDGPARSL